MHVKNMPNKSEFPKRIMFVVFSLTHDLPRWPIINGYISICTNKNIIKIKSIFPQ